MNSARITSLLSHLDSAVDILAEQRTPDALYVAAFDTVKQARALVARAIAEDRQASPFRTSETMADAIAT